MQPMSPRRSGPGPEEEQELAREEAREARDEVHERIGDAFAEERTWAVRATTTTRRKASAAAWASFAARSVQVGTV